MKVLVLSHFCGELYFVDLARTLLGKQSHEEHRDAVTLVYRVPRGIAKARHVAWVAAVTSMMRLKKKKR